jgi:hypothetical protein
MHLRFLTPNGKERYESNVAGCDTVACLLRRFFAEAGYPVQLVYGNKVLRPWEDCTHILQVGHVHVKAYNAEHSIWPKVYMFGSDVSPLVQDAVSVTATVCNKNTQTCARVDLLHLEARRMLLDVARMKGEPKDTRALFEPGHFKRYEVDPEWTGLMGTISGDDPMAISLEVTLEGSLTHQRLMKHLAFITTTAKKAKLQCKVWYTVRDAHGNVVYQCQDCRCDISLA